MIPLPKLPNFMACQYRGDPNYLPGWGGPSSRGTSLQHLCRAVSQDLGGLEVSQGEGGHAGGIDKNRAEWPEGCIGDIDP